MEGGIGLHAAFPSAEHVKGEQRWTTAELRTDLSGRRSNEWLDDLGVPTSHQYDDVCASIEEGLGRGAVYVHCWGGVGRTGTVIGCVLADEGLTYDGSSTS